MLEFGCQGLQHLQITRSLERLRRDDRLAADLVKRVFQLGQSIGRIDIDQYQAKAGRGELCHRPFKAIGRPDTDTVASAQAESVKACGHGIHGVGELLPAPADALFAENDRGTPTMMLNRFRK